MLDYFRAARSVGVNFYLCALLVDVNSSKSTAFGAVLCSGIVQVDCVLWSAVGVQDVCALLA